MTADDQSIVFTRKWQRGVRALTFVVCGMGLVGGFLHDWDDMFGPNVFSGLKPALKAAITRAYGTPVAAPESAGSVTPGSSQTSSDQR